MDESSAGLNESPTPCDLLAFWREAGPERWFTTDAAFDAECRRRWLPLHEAAASGELASWSDTPEGALALIILLDQLPRNMFRGTKRVWATDGLALAAAEHAVERGLDQAIEKPMRQFFYLPFMHAEDRAAHERSLALYEAYGVEEQMHYARHHHGIVTRFGRFPHRNAVLERESTPEELAFLETDPFRG